MLCLKRRLEERIYTSGPCQIVVIGFEKGHVKLGFIAKDSTKIYRGELLKKLSIEEVNELCLPQTEVLPS